MFRITILFAFAALPLQTPSLITTAPPQLGAQRPPAADSNAVRALKVIDSLIPLPPPRSLAAGQARVWSEQTVWLKTLRERIRSLLSLVVAPAKVPTPAPIDQKNAAALLKEAEEESLKFDLSSPPIRARHEAAMNAIRNLK